MIALLKMRPLCVLVLWSVSAFAQKVEGTVINSVTGRGIAGVQVGLSWANEPFYFATTDAQGHFLLDHVDNGSYTVSYSATGYSYEPKGPRQIQVTAGGNSVRLEARMTPLPKVSGRVVDGRGQAAPGAVVRMAGPRAMMTSRTDEDGRFELRQNLPPGSYTLSAIPPPNLKPPDPEPDSDRVRNWVPTYYPGVTTRDAASKVVLVPGVEVSGLEMKLLTAPAHAVRGVLLDSGGKPVPKLAISLSGDLALLSTESRADGTFEFPAVADGEWRVSADMDSGVKWRAMQWIEVTNRELEGIELRLYPPFTVRGKVVMETTKGAQVPRPPSVALDPHVGRNQRDNGILTAVASEAPKARPDADGNFKLENVYAGTYRIIALNTPSGYYLDSVRMGEAEQLTIETEFYSGAAPLTLIYKTNGGIVRGTAEKCASGGVVLVSQDSGLRRPGFLYSTPCDSHDRYEIGALRPGEYYLLAVSGDGPDPWYGVRLDDAVLKQAASVTIRAGETSLCDVKAIKPPPY